MKKLIVVSDESSDSLYTTEFATTVEGFLSASEHPHIRFISTGSSTIESGFVISQIVTTEEYFGRPLDTVLFVNNGIHSSHYKSNLPLKLIVLRMKSGMYVVGFNIGFNFSFIKKDIEEMFEFTELETTENPLRSDVCSRLCAHLLEDMQDELELNEMSTNMISDTSEHFVAYIDSFKAIKTTLKQEQIREKYHYGDTVSIFIGNIPYKVLYVEHTSDHQDEAVICPISSTTRYDSYMEIRGLHARVEVGNTITIQ